jgi:hypothetical protein
VLAASALAAVAAGAWQLRRACERDEEASARVYARRFDRNALRQLIGLARLCRTLPMRDGAFDVYEFVRLGEIRGENMKILRSERSGIGPSEDEIARGDYTNFPWERYRGNRKLSEWPPFPVLWDTRPDADGVVLVGMSDGTVHTWDAERLAHALPEASAGR